MLPEKNIDALIPQKFPFVMIDALTHSDELVTRTSFLISADNIFAEEGVLREPGLLENIAQTAAARVGYLAKLGNKPVPVGFIGAVKNFEIFALPKVNDELETEITITNHVFDVTIITGRVTCNGQLLAGCEMKIVIPEIEKLTP